MVVLCVLVLLVIIAEIVWNYNRLGRILKPKTRKKEEVNLEDLIENRANAVSMPDADITINPVVLARNEIARSEKDDGRVKQRPGAAGALGRLMRGVGGAAARMSGRGAADKRDEAARRVDEAARKKEQIRALDRDLAREGKVAQASAAAMAEEDRMFEQAEMAALEARRL